MLVIIQAQIPHYRREFFNKLGKVYDLVVIHSGHSSVLPGDCYKEYIIPSIKIGPISWQINLFDALKILCPDVIIAGANFRYASSILAMLVFDRKIKWIWWGLDKGRGSISNMIKKLILNRDNAIIFYNEQIREYFSKKIFKKSKFILTPMDYR